MTYEIGVQSCLPHPIMYVIVEEYVGVYKSVVSVNFQNAVNQRHIKHLLTSAWP